MIRFLSVCSGIEAASVATESLGWKAVAFSEIEPFPSAVLAHHWPDVPNLGDMTKYNDWPSTLRFDLLCGGTPCQGFSVAGLRGGLDDPRSQLSLNFVEIAAKYRPRWLVWENVPGVLSSEAGADFANILAALTGREICAPQDGWENSGHVQGIPEAYGVAWRVLDAQFFGVAQRRRRVFVVGCLGDWRRAAAVLFERDSLSGNPPPSREAGKIAPTIPSRSLAGGGLGTDFDCDGGLIPHVAGCLQERDSKGADSDTKPGHLIPVILSNQETPCPFCGYPFDQENLGKYGCPNCCGEGLEAQNNQRNLLCIPIHDQATRHSGKNGDKNAGKGNGLGIGNENDPCPTLTKGDKHAVAFGFNGDQSEKTRSMGEREEQAPTLRSDGPAHVAFGVSESPDVAHCLSSGASKADKHESTTYVASTAVRRLTPTECERLQGFPDGHTLIPWRGKPAGDCPDGPRYKALGNSWAVPCFLWIAKRIQKISTL